LCARNALTLTLLPAPARAQMMATMGSLQLAGSGGQQARALKRNARVWHAFWHVLDTFA
jgi:hypothetical protein